MHNDNGLRAWRQRLRLTQRQAAALVKVKQNTWSLFECGKRVPRPRVAKAIATVTGIPLERVLGLS